MSISSPISIIFTSFKSDKKENTSMLNDKEKEVSVPEEKCCGGSMIDIFREIIELSNIKNYFVYSVPDGFYGGVVSCPNNSRADPTKCQWNGLFNELIQNRADLAVTALTFNSDRAAVADLTEYIDLSPPGIVRSRKTRKQPLITSDYVNVVNPDLAVTLAMTFVGLYIAVLIIEHSSNQSKKRSFYTVHEILTYLSGLTFQRDLGGRNPYFWSARIPCLMYAFGTTIIMTTYTANLTAKGVVMVESDFKELKDDRVRQSIP